MRNPQSSFYSDKEITLETNYPQIDNKLTSEEYFDVSSNFQVY